MNELKISDEVGNCKVYFLFREYASNGATAVRALLSEFLPYGKLYCPH